MIRFIAGYKDHRVVGPDGRVGLRWGVEPMCTVLSEHWIMISPSTCYEQVARQPTRAQVRDQQVAELIRAEREHPGYGRFASTLGSRKMWIRLRGRGHDVARCTVERVMRAHGWQGASYGSRHKTTIADHRHHRSSDLVGRNFASPEPNRLWVCDFTYIPTWIGVVYVAFVIDAYARRIIGWRAARRMNTALVLDALEQAIFTRAQQGITDLSGLVAHSDAGSQYTSIAFTTGLVEAGVDPSVGSVGDALDKKTASYCTSLHRLGGFAVSERAALPGDQAWVAGSRSFEESFVLVGGLV